MRIPSPPHHRHVLDLESTDELTILYKSGQGTVCIEVEITDERLAISWPLHQKCDMKEGYGWAEMQLRPSPV